MNLAENSVPSENLHHLLKNIGIVDVSKYIEEFRQKTEEIVVEQAEELETKNRVNDLPTSDTEKSKDLSTWLRIITSNDYVEQKNDTKTDLLQSTTGNLSTWLYDWSRNLGRTDPTSLDSWLQSLIPTNLHETNSDKSFKKTKLDEYLNDARKILSEHGYNISPPSKETVTMTDKIGFLDNIKHLYFLWKSLDKNHDRKITVEDFEILLRDLGLNFLSKSSAAVLFNAVDTNHDGKLQSRDFLALMNIVKQLIMAKKSNQI